MPTYLSEHVYTGNGSQTDFVFNKGYLSRSHVIVKVSTDGGDTFTTKTDPTDYEWIDSQTIRFAAAPANAAVIWLDRVTPRTIDQTYDNGTVFTDVTQNYAYRQPIYILQETLDDLDRRPALDVNQSDIEETLAQVLGNLTVSGDELVKTSFDLKATIGRDAGGRLVISLTKENEASSSLVIPGVTAIRQGGARIVDYTPDFLGDLFYDNGGSPTRPGITPDSYLDESIEWDGVFPVNVAGTAFFADHDAGGGQPPADTLRLLKIRTESGEFTNLHSGLTNVGRSGDHWEVRITPWLDGSLKYNHRIVYRKLTLNARYPPPWGVYTLAASTDPLGGTSSKFEGVGNNFPATLTIAPT